MARLVPPAVSFAIVFVAYWAYALLAVPFIEPEAKAGQAGSISREDRSGGSSLGDGSLRRFLGLFPADSWIHKSPKVLESDRVVLLTQDYRNLGDGRMDIRPCTIIFLPAEAQDDPSRLQESVILEAPDGALLEFDKPLDLSRAEIGRLTGGKLNGRITIRSKGKNPGPNDDLLIVTRNVQLSQQHVWTPNAVDFRLGPNYGRGEQMHIKLLANGEKQSSDASTRVDGIESFEMRRVKRLHLELNGAKLPTQTAGPGEPIPPQKRPADEEHMPVEITCRGPFKFDAVGKVATFRDHVDVLRINPSGPSDQLNCELLSIFFTERETANKDKAERNGKQQSLDLEPLRLEARGDPVVVTAPSRNALARGQVLEYNLRTEQLSLDSSSVVHLQQKGSEIHARSLKYKPAGEDRLGQLTATGPGWINARLGRQPDQVLKATWKKQLLVRPDQQNQMISLDGGTRLAFGGFGSLDAGEIHFWLQETAESKTGRPNAGEPSDKQAMRLSPDRMLAKNAVKLDSPQLSGSVEQLEVWFEEKNKAGGGNTSPQQRGGTTSPASTQPGIASTRSDDKPQPAAPPKQRFSIVGRLLQARVLYQEGEETALSELIVEDGVRFAETQTAKPDEKPLLISGERLHMTGAEGPHAAATVTGRPAHFEARGLGLTGSNININRGTDRLWIDGAGRMDLPIDRDPEGNKLAVPGVMKVDWKNRMEFDGRTATFEESVVAAGPQQVLRTETLEVQFDRHIDFSQEADPSSNGKRREPEVEQLICRGGVLMENRTVEELSPGGATVGNPLAGEKRQTSYDRMQVPTMRINLKSGAILTGGPGWLHSVRLREGESSSIGGFSPPVPTSREKDNGDVNGVNEGSQLVGLHVRFQGAITGNVHRRSMTFNNRVHAAYAPADSWQTILDTEDPERLGPQGVVLHCDRLTVTEMKTPVEGKRSMELEAAGNTVVESAEFTARAIRMTYAEAKGLLVFEGDGRNDARLFRQKQLGGPASEAAARRILYWPKTKRWKIDGMRTVMGVESTSRRP